jgi:hypothetical protein
MIQERVVRMEPNARLHLDEIDWGDGAISAARYRRHRLNPRDISYAADVHRATVPFIVKPSPAEPIDPARVHLRHDHFNQTPYIDWGHGPGRSRRRLRNRRDIAYDTIAERATPLTDKASPTGLTDHARFTAR